MHWLKEVTVVENRELHFLREQPKQREKHERCLNSLFNDRKFAINQEKHFLFLS